jgi:hypothetical protein
MGKPLYHEEENIMLLDFSRADFFEGYFYGKLSLAGQNSFYSEDFAIPALVFHCLQSVCDDPTFEKELAESFLEKMYIRLERLQLEGKVPFGDWKTEILF